MWKLNNTLLNNQWVKEEIRKHSEVVENEDTISQNLNAMTICRHVCCGDYAPTTRNISRTSEIGIQEQGSWLHVADG